MLDLDAARAELRSKSKRDIERETAEKWGARAVAAYELFAATQNLAWYKQGVEYEHEAVEHAAEADPETRRAVPAAVEQARVSLGGLP